MTDVGDLPEPDCSWPVLVTERKEHVVWVQANSAQHALEILKHDGCWYERISMDTLANAWPEFALPGRYDDRTVAEAGEAGYYPGTEADAHVQAHEMHLRIQKRDRERTECRAAGHPKLEPARTYTTDRLCPTCGWLKAEQLTADVTPAVGEVAGPAEGSGPATATAMTAAGELDIAPADGAPKAGAPFTGGVPAAVPVSAPSGDGAAVALPWERPGPLDLHPMTDPALEG